MVKNVHFISGRAKYCSKDCQYIHRRQNLEIQCKECLKMFVLKKSTLVLGRKFCSQKCRLLFERKNGNPRRNGHFKNCAVCRVDFYVQLHQIKNNRGIVCSPECRGILVSRKLSGMNSPHWKGGIYRDLRGYVYINNHDHPRGKANGFVKRSVLVLEKKIGRLLKKDECCHHINEIKDDDRPENLMAMSRDDHNKLHGKLNHERHTRVRI